MAKKTKRLFRLCLRCGWEWIARKPDTKICPKCKSRLWNTRTGGKQCGNEGMKAE